jgi:hypothetical protein
MRRSVRLLAAALALAAAPLRGGADAPPAAIPAPSTPGQGAPAPDLHARPPVANLSDLHGYGAADPVVGERVDRLRTRRNVAIAAFGGAVGAGFVGGIIAMAKAVNSPLECPA